MNCESFRSMTPLEQSTFIGQLVHAAQSDEALFIEAQKLIRRGWRKGIFDGVVINPINKLEDEIRETLSLNKN